MDENIGGYGIKNYFPITDQIQFFQGPDLYKEEEYAMGITIENNTILVNNMGFWNKFQSAAFTFENFLDCKNCIIRNNILNNVLSLVDNGAHSNGSFYAGPRYNIYNNTFNLFDNGGAVESMAPNIEFHHNYIFGGAGLSSFDGSSIPSNYYDGLNYHHNVFYYQKGIFPLSSWTQPPLNFKFNNNTIIDYRGSNISLGGNSINRNMEVKNNIFANIDPTITTTPINKLNEIDNTNSVISNNLFYNIAPYGANSLVADPQLLGAGMKPYTYFQLKKGSPAIDKGLVIPGTTDGFKGAAPDLGAFETDFENITTNSAVGNVGIGTRSPETSAALDILSNTQGILIPRLTMSNIQNMPSPDEGLLVFCSDCSPKSFFYCDGNQWQKINGGITLGNINQNSNTDSNLVAIGTQTPSPSAALEVNSPTKGFLLPRINSLSDIVKPTEGLLVYLKEVSNKGVYFNNGSNWQKMKNTTPFFNINTSADTSNLTGIGIKENNTYKSAIYNINTDNKGLLMPRLGKTQMESIKNPATGLLVYCHDCVIKGFYYNNGTNWQNAYISAPSEPQNVKVTTNLNTATVTYTVPISNGGSPINSYTVVCMPGNITQTTNNNSVEFSGLTSNINYIFLVSASNIYGTSQNSASNPVVIGVPEVPTLTYAINGTSSATAEVYFTPPTQTGGSPITNYTVTVLPNNIQYTANQSPFLISGLNLNSTYTFTVKANNVNGTGLPALTNAITVGPAISTITYPLDAVSATPTVAYSLRKLRTNFNGPMIKIRRESDNQTIDIGFDYNGNLNVGLISSFCGVSKGFVTKWYDQSGNARDLENVNIAGQPLIYNGFGIESLNDKPVIKFLNSSNFLRTVQSVLSNSNEITTFTTAYSGFYETIFQHGNGSGQGHMYARREFGNYGFNVNGNSLSESPTYPDGSKSSPLRTLTCRNTVTDSRRHLRVNGNNSGSVNSVQTVNFTNDKLTIGASFKGHIGEHIEYNSYIPLTAIEQIENNQSLYYLILQPCLANSTPPSKPTQVFASSVSNTSASISFIPPTNTGSRPINYYEVKSSIGNFKQTGTSSPIIISGLSAGENYSFSVKAVNYCDDESQTENSNSIVLGQIAAPANVSVVKGVAEGSAVVSFTAPTFTNNQTITGYTVTSTPDNIQVTGITSPITITGLSDEKKYTFIVVANTTTTTSLPSLVSNSIYAHTQILNDMPAPNTAFGLRKLLSSYNGSAINVRRADNTTQDIGFLPNGELDEATLLNFVGSGNGFITTWYDQSGNNRNLVQITFNDQPIIVSNGELVKKNNQISLRFYSTDGLNITVPLATTRVFHSVWNAAGPLGRWGMLVKFNPNIGNGGVYFGSNNSIVTNVNNFYNSEVVYVNSNQTGEFAPLDQLKALTTKTASNPMPSNATNFKLGQDLDYFGSGFGNVSNLIMFTDNLSDADRIKLEKRESACFELGF